MESTRILKVTERCQAKLPLFFMSTKQHKNEFILSEKIKLYYIRIKQFCETAKFLTGQLQSPLVLEFSSEYDRQRSKSSTM